MKRTVFSLALTILFLWGSVPSATSAGNGDINGDGRVDILDLAIVSASFNSSTPSEPGADANSDGIVDIFDLALVGASFGWVRPDITRYPYLQSTTATSNTIAWKTNIPSSSSVDYGLTASYGLSNTETTKATDHTLTLTGLSPDTTYHYRLRDNGANLTPDETFKTAPGPGAASFSFVVFGDSGDGSVNMLNVANLVKTLNPDFLIHTGDLIYPAGEAQNFDPRFFVPYRDVLKNKPVFPTMGNHDTYTSSGQPWLDAFYLSANNPAGTERYYSFDYGNAHFVSLHVTEDIAFPSQQRDWLIADLQAATQTWKFVFFHVPPYSSSKHGSALNVRTSLSPILEQYGVDMVLNGHDHDYERTKTIRDYYPDGKGVVYIVTGGGGAGLYSAGTSSFTAYSASVWHATLVQINGAALTLRAIRTDGTVMDSFAIDRNAAPSP